MEYIEREAAIRAALIADCEDVSLNDVIKVMGEVAEAIKSVPAADVAPVRHGRWVKAKGAWCTPGGDPVWECSECGKGRHVYGIEHGTYGGDIADGQWVACPNCGAKME